MTTIINGSSPSITFSDSTTQSTAASAAGANTQVQYNSSGSFAGSASLTFNSGTGALSATSFSGAGTGLTGTASSLSVGGNAATATTANALNTANNYQVNSLGVGTSSTVAGQIKSTTAIITPNTAGVSTGLTVVNGDLTTYRTGGTTGAIYLSSSGSDYVYYNGSQYYFGANIAITSASSQIAKAWVNFNGTTSSVKASYNVSSITNIGTGKKQVNFTSALADTNYAALASINQTGLNGLLGTKTATTTSSYFQIDMGQNNSLSDFTEVSVSVFR